jgi:hypothetical protein
MRDGCGIVDNEGSEPSTPSLWAELGSLQLSGYNDPAPPPHNALCGVSQCIVTP